MAIKLSILICSTHTRYLTFGPKIQKQIWTQYSELAEPDQARIEIMMLTDNKKMMLGDKRNVMVDAAQGEYVVFVDDDDRIEPDYMKSLLDAIDANPGVDVVVFHASVSLNGEPPKRCVYSKEWRKDHNTREQYNRLPNHICCTRKELASKVSYPSVLYGEDKGYAKLLASHLKTEHQIGRVLYHYDYSDETTETQTHVATVIRKREQPAIVDVVMLSKASTPELQDMTQNAIDTCLAGANSLPVNIIVIEQEPEVFYDNAQTVFHDAPFHYNQFAALGAAQGCAPWVMIANNDLVFTNGWLHALLEAEYPLVSPKCPDDGRQRDITENAVGDRIGRHISGWAYMISRELWDQIGGADPRFAYWCADDALVEQCRREGVLPMLVPASVVRHLGSKTGGTSHGDGSRTWAGIKLFSEVYGPHRLQGNGEYQKWLANQLG